MCICSWPFEAVVAIATRAKDSQTDVYNSTVQIYSITSCPKACQTVEWTRLYGLIEACIYIAVVAILVACRRECVCKASSCTPISTFRQKHSLLQKPSMLSTQPRPIMNYYGLTRNNRYSYFMHIAANVSCLGFCKVVRACSKSQNAIPCC